MVTYLPALGILLVQKTNLLYILIYKYFSIYHDFS